MAANEAGAANQDFCMYSGDTPPFAVMVYKADGVTAEDLTGATGRWNYTKKDDATGDFSSTPILSPDKTELNGGLVFSITTEGLVNIILVAADTDSQDGSFYHELEIILASGQISTTTTGAMAILKALLAA